YSLSGARRDLPSFPTRRSSDLFLGLGVQPPDYDWGRLLFDGFGRIYIHPEVALGPAAAIALAGIGFNLLGDALARHAARTPAPSDRKSTRLNSSHVKISYAVFC